MELWQWLVLYFAIGGITMLGMIQYYRHTNKYGMLHDDDKEMLPLIFILWPLLVIVAFFGILMEVDLGSWRWIK